MARGKNTKMPNLVVIGAAKCGTTSLHHYLDLHPEISMSRIKEPRYFLSHLPPDPKRPRIDSRDDYLALFEPGAEVRGEASVAYSARHRFPGVAARIAREVPQAKLVYLVRDPFERMISAITANIAERKVPGPATGAISDLAELVGDTEGPNNELIDRGRYMSQLREYLRYFSPESILIVDSDLLMRDRTDTLASIFEFLGVDAGFEDRRFAIERNSSRSKAVGPLNERLRGSPALRRANVLLPEPVRRVASRGLRRFTGDEVLLPPMDHELRDRLGLIFGPEVEALRDFTGQDFPGWSI